MVANSGTRRMGHMAIFFTFFANFGEFLFQRLSENGLKYTRWWVPDVAIGRTKAFFLAPFAASQVPVWSLSRISDSLWKVYSPKFTCRIVHSTDPIGPESPNESTPKR